MGPLPMHDSSPRRIAILHMAAAVAAPALPMAGTIPRWRSWAQSCRRPWECSSILNRKLAVQVTVTTRP